MKVKFFCELVHIDNFIKGAGEEPGGRGRRGDVEGVQRRSFGQERALLELKTGLLLNYYILYDCDSS